MKHRKERKTMMDSLMKFFLFLLCVAGVAYWKRASLKQIANKIWELLHGAPVEEYEPPLEDIPSPEMEGPAYQKTQQDLAGVRNDLEQRMTKLVGGTTGMAQLKNRIAADPDGNTEVLRSSYREKKARLSELYNQYQQLMAEAERLPTGDGPALCPLQDEDLYKKLLEFEA